MSSGKTKLVFFGNERLVSGLSSTTAPVLNALIDHGYDIAAVVAHHSDTRSRNGRPLEVAQVAEEHGIPLLTPDRPLDIHDQLSGLNAEAGVLVAYGKILPQKLIDLFPRGIINVHPSLLPHYRGPTPLEAPILNGDSKSGVSIMALAAKMDAGPIYAQAEFPISATDTKFDIYEKASALSKDLLIDTLPSILDGSLQPTPQDEANATFCQLINKDDGRIDWSQPAEIIERKIRAFIEWPQSRARLNELDIIITAAHVVDENGKPGEHKIDEGKLVVFTGEKALAIDSLKPSGKKEMPVQAFLAGYRQKL